MKFAVAFLFLATLLGLTCSKYSKGYGRPRHHYSSYDDYQGGQGGGYLGGQGGGYLGGQGGGYLGGQGGGYLGGQGGGYLGGQGGGYLGGQGGGYLGGQGGGYLGGQGGGYLGGQGGGYLGGQGGGFYGGQTLPGGGRCPYIACYVPACQVQRCDNFPFARCVGFCNGCTARFYYRGIDVTHLCGRHHKKHRRY
ncbi:ctenidin-1-like [Saccostrea cucullata]|uniref:ctenidin-1-like n=1 Tax=Saccostrea cuccullata TaxID=36930 RepID=UPI002ED5F783